MPMKGPELPLSVGNDHYWLHDPLGVCLGVCIRKIIYTRQGNVGFYPYHWEMIIIESIILLGVCMRKSRSTP